MEEAARLTGGQQSPGEKEEVGEKEVEEDEEEDRRRKRKQECDELSCLFLSSKIAYNSSSYPLMCVRPLISLYCYIPPWS